MANYNKDKINILFFDDSCAMCNAWVRFVLKVDKDGKKFIFSPLHSHFFNKAIPEEIRKTLPDSIIVLSSQLDLFYKTEAVCFILKELSGFWLILGLIINLFPLKFSNFIYDLVAKNRKRFFKADRCEVLEPEVSKRIVYD